MSREEWEFASFSVSSLVSLAVVVGNLSKKPGIAIGNASHIMGLFADEVTICFSHPFWEMQTFTLLVCLSELQLPCSLYKIWICNNLWKELTKYHTFTSYLSISFCTFLQDKFHAFSFCWSAVALDTKRIHPRLSFFLLQFWLFLTALLQQWVMFWVFTTC